MQKLLHPLGDNLNLKDPVIRDVFRYLVGTLISLILFFSLSYWFYKVPLEGIVDAKAFSFGVSKLYQIIVPLGVFALFQELPQRQKLIRRVVRLVQRFQPSASPEKYEYLIGLTLGFISWKIGCDLGFMLISQGIPNWKWERAFTWGGLIPYTVLQYVFYYLIGQKIIILGQLNPFKEGGDSDSDKTAGGSSWKQFLANRFPRYTDLYYFPGKTSVKYTGRPSPWEMRSAKFLHESMNATSYSVPLRQVVLKPFVDYGGIIISWSFYNVGLLFVQSGEFNISPLIYFNFLEIFAFYVVNVYGYILGYNVGEFLYLRILDLGEFFESWDQEPQKPKVLETCNTFPLFLTSFLRSTAYHGLLTAVKSWEGVLMSIDQFSTLLGYGRSPNEVTKNEVTKVISSPHSLRVLTWAKAIRQPLVISLSVGDVSQIFRYYAGRFLLYPFSKSALYQLLMGVGRRWELFQSARLWAFYPFLERYGISMRWFVSCLCGLVAIVMLEPNFAGAIFSTSASIQHSLYNRYGQFDSVLAQQIVHKSTVSAAPPSQMLLDNFPAKWGALYFED